MRGSRILAIAFTLPAGLAGFGCASSNKDTLHFLREHEHEVAAIEYRVGIPDGIAVSAPRILEIDGETQRIHPDGKISLRLLGDVKIVGMTAKEIAAKLEVLLSRYYSDPKVSVRIVNYESKKYYVYGQATNVGPRPFTGRDTLLDAVIRSGTNFLSWTSRVKVIRPAHDETPVRTLEVDIDRMVKTGDWSKNILLEPNDMVYIPPTPAAWLGLRVREVIYPFAPAAQAYTFPAQIKSLENTYDDENQQQYYGNSFYNYGGVGP